MDYEKIVKLRKEIHQNPDLSSQEQNTAKRIQNFITGFNPDKIITGLGGAGIAAVFDGKNPGPVIMFRSELDALPIIENTKLEYRSIKEGVSHKCGHDGHMATLAGFAMWLSENRPEKGKVVLLFQPAEETGEGAERVIGDPKFQEIYPDYIFAYHNLPGFAKGEVILRKGTFASASRGQIIDLRGRTSHAAEPEKGISPAGAMCEIIEKISALPQKLNPVKSYLLTTVIHAKLGEIAFGTSPGEAVVMSTLRAGDNEDMEKLIDESEAAARQSAGDKKLEVSISYREIFPAAFNDPEKIDIVKECAADAGFNTIELDKPFRWSEDFGWFTEKIPGVLFGIGAGENHPPLHDSDYDFPDELIPRSIKLFQLISKRLTG